LTQASLEHAASVTLTDSQTNKKKTRKKQICKREADLVVYRDMDRAGQDRTGFEGRNTCDRQSNRQAHRRTTTTTN